MQQYTPQFLLSLLHKILYFQKFLHIGAFAPFIMITKCDCKNHLKRVENSAKNYFLLTIYHNPLPSPLSHKKLLTLLYFLHAYEMNFSNWTLWIEPKRTYFYKITANVVHKNFLKVACVFLFMVIMGNCVFEARRALFSSHIVLCSYDDYNNA